MFNGIKNGWQLLKLSITTFGNHPVLLVPLLVIWVVFAPVILWLQFGLDLSSYSNGEGLLLAFGVIFVFAFLLVFSASVLLELIQQHETGEAMSLGQAFGDTLRKNSYKLLPIVVVWSLIWFLLTLLESIFSSKDNSDSSDKDLSAENAANTLSGAGDSTSFLSLSFDALRKGVRMIVFLILPAVAWEDKNTWTAAKRGLSILRHNKSAFITGYVMTGLITWLVFLPVALISYGSAEMGVSIPSWGWLLVILYTAFAWSYSMYLEQMFTAELFLWYKNWEKEVEIANKANEKVPAMNDVSRPSLLDHQNDLVISRAPPEPPANKKANYLIK